MPNDKSAPTASKPDYRESDQAAAGKTLAEAGASDQATVTTTTSPAHAASVLQEAIGRIFATQIDDQMRNQMPDFWQLYYAARAGGVAYRPRDLDVARAIDVDQQAKLVSSIAPDSNEFAQNAGVAGSSLYRAVIGKDGKAGEIAVVRPIGFGLDENAVAAIRKATFQPAMKGGQPVAETLDLGILFRIYSKRTSVAAANAPAPDEKTLKPGPYTVRVPPPPKMPEPELQPATDQPATAQPDQPQPAPAQPTQPQTTQPPQR